MATKNNDHNGYYIGRIWVSPQHNVLTCDQKTVNIQPKVMAVLDYLVTHRQRVIDNDELLDKVWQGRVVTHSSVQKSINALRVALGQLDDSQEYVVHFSKSGYQLVVPVELSKPRPSKTLLYFRWYYTLPSALALLVAITIVFWPERLKQQWEVPSTATLRYSKAQHVLANKGSEHTAAKHPTTGEIAFIRDKTVDAEIKSQLVVSDTEGQEWIVSTASGYYTDIAWSESGRNLVSVDRIEKDGPITSKTFFENPHQYYTFHIFTLDFKGERVLEKNRLSYWLGEVKSVTWYNENTLEFVASQAPQVESRRYRYVIPTQKLTQLQPIAPGSVPLISKVAKGITAILRIENNNSIVSIIDESDVRTDWPVSGVNDLEFESNGNGLLLLNGDDGRLSLLHLNGEITALNLPNNLRGQVTAASFGHRNQILATMRKPIRARLIWNQTNENPLDINSQEGHIISATIVDKTKSLYAIEKDMQLSVMLIENFKARELATIALTHRIISLVWINQGEQLVLALSNGDVILLNVETSEQSVLISAKMPMKILGYDPSSDQAWGISNSERVRNLWRIGITKGSFEQLIFGGLADVLATNDGFYFQYLSRSGLWFLNKKGGDVTQVASSMPLNVHLIAAENNTVFFITGGECHESDVYALDLATDIIGIDISSAPDNMQTLAFDKFGGVIRRSCEQGDLDVVGLSL